MRKEHPSTDQRVRFMSSYFLKPLQQCPVDPFCTKLDDKFIVVDCGLFSILGNGALYVPRCDNLLVSRGLRGTGVGFGSVDDFGYEINPRSELQDGTSLRGEGRRRERRGYGVDDGGWGYLRHAFGRVNAASASATAHIIDCRSGRDGEEEKMIRPGLEPGAFCVLDRCDNQLRHRTHGC